MNLKLPIFLSSIGIIVALWPEGNLFIKMGFAIAILMAAALPLMVKKSWMKWVSLGGVLILFAAFIGITAYKKFDSIKAYMNDLKSPSEVRYVDVEMLSKQFGVEGWNPYFEEWESKCMRGGFEYCRIASYVSRVKREKRAEELLRLGCSNRDFLSCYNFFFYDEFGIDDRKFAKEAILSQCSGNLSKEFSEICERVKTL
jgi:hypothetical protein